MPKHSAAEVADKWSRRLQAAVSGGDLERGANRVTVSPTEKAAAQIRVMRDNFNAAIDSGKTEKRLRDVTLADWKQAYLAKAPARVRAGAEAAKPKVQAVMDQILAYEDSVLASLPPRGDFQQNVARMLAWAERMKQFQRR